MGSCAVRDCGGRMLKLERGRAWEIEWEGGLVLVEIEGILGSCLSFLIGL